MPSLPKLSAPRVAGVHALEEVAALLELRGFGFRGDLHADEETPPRGVFDRS